jgi:type 1 glutamine amidotransferase
VVTAMLAMIGAFAAVSAARAQAEKKKILVVTHTAGFRHDSIPTAKEVMKQLADQSGLFSVEFANDAADVQRLITAENLKNYDAIVFANTTGDLPISEENKKAFMEWLRGGKGFVGTHAATDTFPGWPDYTRMIGGHFDGHPWTQEVTVKVEDRDNPATRHLGETFKIKDEIYQFKDYARSDKKVLLAIDNRSIDLSKGKREDQDYAVAWMKREGSGRVFYTSLGHFKEVWTDPRYQQHLLNGLKWALGLERARVQPGQ